TSLICCIYMIGAVKKNKFFVFKPNKAEIFFFLFILICFISWLLAFIKFSDYRIAVFSEGYRAFVVLFFGGVLPFLIPTYFIDEQKDLNKVISILFFAASIASFYGILQFFGIELIWPKALTVFANRCVSTFGNPNFLSSFLVLLIPLSIYKIIYSKDLACRILWGVSSLLMLFALGCTLTRSSWLGLICGGMFFIVFYMFQKLVNFKKILKVFAFIFILSSIFVFFTPFKGYLADRLDKTFTLKHENRAIYQRLLIWKSVKDIWQDNPVLGSGWGTLEMIYPFYQSKYLKEDPYSKYRTHANNAHNEILEVLSQTGILGFGMYFLFYICFFIYIFSLIRKSNLREDQKMEFAAFLAGIIGVLIDNTLNVSLHFIVPSMVFWFIVGATLRKAKELKNEHIRVQINGNSLINIGFLIASMFFIVISAHQFRFFLAEKNYFKGFIFIRKAAAKSSPNIFLKSKKYLQRARGLHKYEVNNLYELGNVSVKLGLFDEGIKYYKEAISANPGYDEIYFNTGVMLYKKGLLDEALDFFIKSNEINPLNEGNTYALFNVYLKKGDKKKALHVLENSMQLNKNHIILTNLGTLYSQEKLWDKAVLYYQKALELKPGYSLAVRNLELAKAGKSGVLTPFLFEYFQS
ncbi:O-antigen ligase family protein, partial [bacterium]